MVWEWALSFVWLIELREEVEKIHLQGDADGQELLGVDGGFEEYLLYRARMHMDAVGQPLVGVPLSS